jgi:hypothetical protein
MGQRSSNTTAVTFKEVLVPKKTFWPGREVPKAMTALDITGR